MTPKRLIELLEALDLNPRRYSGRSMFGKDCVGVDPDSFSSFTLGVRLAMQIVAESPNPTQSDALSTLAALVPSEDRMGYGTIIYWPRMEWPTEEQE